jgi:hypothetical protein
LHRTGTIRIFELELNNSAEYGLHFAQRTDLTTPAHAASETFIASNRFLSAASSAAPQQLLLPLPPPPQKPSVVPFSGTGALESVQSGRARAGGAAAARRRRRSEHQQRSRLLLFAMAVAVEGSRGHGAAGLGGFIGGGAQHLDLRE